MFKRGTASGALLMMALSAAAFFGTLQLVSLIPESYFVHRPNWVYLPPVIQIPILVVVGASVLGGAWGLLQLALILMVRLNRGKSSPAEADPEGIWPPAPTATLFE